MKIALSSSFKYNYLSHSFFYSLQNTKERESSFWLIDKRKLQLSGVQKSCNKIWIMARIYCLLLKPQQFTNLTTVCFSVCLILLIFFWTHIFLQHNIPFPVSAYKIVLFTAPYTLTWWFILTICQFTVDKNWVHGKDSLGQWTMWNTYNHSCMHE